MEDNTIKIELGPESMRLLKQNNELLLKLVGSGKRSLSEEYFRISDIAKVIGRSTKTARRRVAKAGLVGNKQGRDTYYRRSEIERMFGVQSNE